MKLRRRIVLTAAALLLSVGLIVTIAAIWLMKTDSGLGFVRSQFVNALSGKVKSNFHVGGITGDLNSPTIDSIEVRDMDDSVIFASGPISFELNLLDLWEKRIALRNVVIERPYFHLRRVNVSPALPSGEWNYKPMMNRDTGSVIPKVTRTGRKLGDYIVLDSVELRGGEFKWTDMWAPAKWLTGVARDSATRFNLARKDVDVQRIGGKLVKVRHWDSLGVFASRVQIKDPDRPGFAVEFSRLNALESDPPFNLRNATGTVTLLRDTVTVAVKSFQLPGSSGSAEGNLFLKPGLGVRVRVVGDTVSMKDIAWLYPTMPTEGTGKMVLDIRKDSTRDHIDYAISNMDVSTTQSRLRGAMTFGVGEEILGLTNVDVDLAPVNFKLFEQFAGAPLTLPWAGDLTGHVKARGGPLNRFVVDSMAINFADANNAGVVNRFSGRGMLDIVRPLYTTFYDFSAQIYHFDLWTARKLDSLFPPLAGSVYGSAQLDSIWTDVRLRNASIYYAADSAQVSHFTGGGRVTVGEVEMSYDLALVADPILVGSFALSYPDHLFRGTFRGPFTVKGSLAALELTGDLEGEGGRVKTTGLTVDDLYPRLGATGTVELTTIDLSRVLIKPPTWKGIVTATIDAAISGDSIENLEGRTRVRLGKSAFADIAVREGYSSFTFGDGLIRVDSLNVMSDAFALQGKGALGLRRDRRDTLHLTTQLDSLGGFRQFLAPVVDSLPADSLKGRVTASAHLFGSLDSLGLRATANGADVVYGTTTARTVEAGFDIDDLTGRRVGTASITARTMQALGIKFSDMRADARLTGGDSARVIAKLTSETGPVIDGGANVAWDSLSMHTVLDSLQIAIDDHRWRLTRPARILSTANVLTIDTLEMRTGDNARLAFAANIPTTGLLAGEFRAEAFPLSDLGKLFQVTLPVSGVSAVGASLSGTRDAPVMMFELNALDAGVGETRVEGLRVFGGYGDRMLNAKLEYKSKGAIVMNGEAKLPMDLAFRPVAQRMLDLPMSASLKADSTDLGLIKTFWSGIKDASGRLDVDLTARGTWAKPEVAGKLRIERGNVMVTQLGLPYSDIRAQIRFTGDSIVIDTLSARSGGQLRFNGYVNLADRTNPEFRVTAKAAQFHAIANTAIADLTITTDSDQGIRLCCRKLNSTLSGALTADGRIYIPDTYTKNLIQIDPAYLGNIDTNVFRARRLLPPAPSAIVANMEVESFSIRAGDNLTLRSAEANVGLAGSLNLNVKPSPTGAQLDLLGTLSAKRGGTYRLNLGLYQRTFAVDTGTINFFGDPAIDAEMNLTASYTIRQYDQRDARQDIRVVATVAGSLSAPSISLSSPDTRLSNADLFSYVAVGTPSLEIGGRNSSYISTATAGLITSGASALSANVAGGACNLSPATVTGGANNGIAQTSRSILAGTRAGCGLQLSSIAFLRVDFGLCTLNQIGDLASSVGLKLDLRLPNSSTLAFGADPSTNALTCTQNTNTRGFVPTPRQLGIDLFRSWRW